MAARLRLFREVLRTAHPRRPEMPETIRKTAKKTAKEKPPERPPERPLRPHEMFGWWVKRLCNAFRMLLGPVPEDCGDIFVQGLLDNPAREFRTRF